MSYELITKCLVQRVFFHPKFQQTFVQRLLHSTLLLIYFIQFYQEMQYYILKNYLNTKKIGGGLEGIKGNN